MYAIEDHGSLKFYDGKKKLTLQEGFQRLESIYNNEPFENKKIIKELKEKYLYQEQQHEQ